ncbi:hypothetical protein vBEliSR6L_57 [Erythrobacter phage vB_EliS_R6L]|nr:hypothetical protein vBEliSR6L_57 [Erythrobacter phage vB_EliS_R6L]
MSVRAFPMPAWPNSGKRGWCKWCGQKIPTVIDGKKSTQRMWHPACVYQWELHTRRDAQLAHLIERDGRRCRTCPEGAPIPKHWVKGPEIVQYRPTPSFKHLAPVGTPEWLALVEAWRRENPSPRYSEVDLVEWLEVDHRTPLWEVADLPDEERRWYFGPGNLWLLCGLCHQKKTAREARRRAAGRRAGDAQINLDL